MTSLDLLPVRTGGAAENMALDFLLLQRYPAAATPRFRHYGWRAPAFTFGYAQKIEFVRGQLPSDGHFDLCRRPTGGGIVDHREDWTYALVIPRGHPLEETRATQAYRAIHEALAAALAVQGVPAELKASEVERVDLNALSLAPEGVCFSRAETFDVVHARTGRKIAGAAQKRNKHGLLFQGSVWRPAVGEGPIDWEKFAVEFGQGIAAALGAEGRSVPWPELNEEEVEGLIEQYSAPEWIEHR